MSSLTSPQASNWLAKHPKLGVSLMDHLFNRLDGMYPNKWRASFGSEQAIENWRQAWAEAFIEEGISPQSVQNGLRTARTKFPWPPSLPEFLAACRPDLEPERAWHESVVQMGLRLKGEQDSWSHPAVYWTANKFSWELRSESYQRMKTQWGLELEKQIKKGQWDEIPPPMVRLPEPEIKADPEKAAAARAKIKELLSQLKGGTSNDTEQSMSDRAGRT
jgi:hypothetical protein